MGHTSNNMRQVSFRGRNDDGDASGATWIASENTNFTTPMDRTFRVRFEVSEESGNAAAADTYILEYFTAGSWVQITTTTTDAIYIASSPNLSEPVTDNTDRLSTATTTFQLGRILDTAASASITVSASNHIELEWTLVLNSSGFNNGTTVQIRVSRATAGALDGYDQTPTITACHDLRQDGFRGVNDDAFNGSFIAAENANFDQNMDTPFRLRLALDCESGDAVVASTYKIQFNLNSGGWTDVGSATAVKYVSSAYVSDGETSSSNRLSTPPGTFYQAKIEVNQGTTGTSFSVSGNQYYELEWCLQIDSGSVSVSDTIEFRMVNGAGAVLPGGYDTVPVATAASSGPLAVTGNHISTTAVLNAPTVIQNVTGGTFSNTATVNQPTVSYQVDPPAIASTATLYEATVTPGPVSVTGDTIASTASANVPTVAYRVAAAVIASTLALLAPTLAYSATGGTIASGSTLAEPTVAPGPVSVTGAAIASTATLNEPSVAYRTSAATIASGAVLNQPTLAYSVSASAVSSSAALYEPTVALSGGPQSVTGEHIASTIALSAPDLAYALSAATISSAATESAPTIAYAVLGDTISSGSTPNPATVSPGPVSVTGAAISTTAVLYEPTVTQGAQLVTGASIGSTASATSPSISYHLAAPTIGSAASLAAPSIDTITNITGAHLASTAATNGPSVSVGAVPVTGATVSSTASPSAPMIAYAIDAATVASGSTIATPTVAYRVAGATIGSGHLLLLPAVSAEQFAIGATISSTATMSAPTITTGGAREVSITGRVVTHYHAGSTGQNTPAASSGSHGLTATRQLHNEEAG